MTNKLESTKKSFDEINSYDKKRREKEKNFLQYQSQHLEAILKQFKSKILFGEYIKWKKIRCNAEKVEQQTKELQLLNQYLFIYKRLKIYKRIVIYASILL